MLWFLLVVSQGDGLSDYNKLLEGMGMESYMLAGLCQLAYEASKFSILLGC